ncbi:MAG: apolipoprotein N-acyltransferase [Actinobacteria bacterium]|nr:apolipoprotein N-acyltransferase [Actinomycetota bacterium]
MIPWFLALLGALVSVLAFPPFGPGWLIVIGTSLFLAAIRLSATPRQGLLIGVLYGLGFFGGLLWWLSELELLALILVPVQALYIVVFAWWLSRQNHRDPGSWSALAVGGWALMELVRYHFPVGGFEWGAAGYALSDALFTRRPAAVVGTSGLTILVVLIAAVTASAIARRFEYRLLWSIALILAVALVSSAGVGEGGVDGGSLRTAIVQGSTPCPFERCPPDERRRTYQQHLELTRTIEPGDVDLVVWPEGSTGATNADPVLNEDVREAIAAEVIRLGAAFLVGGDRTVSDTHWINANVYFDDTGLIAGEYRKQHPVPFGEYIPWRPVFGSIPALDRVPRDMIRGDGPVIFDLGGYRLGSVISFEGGFSRYALQHRRAGAEVLVVATNEASYGLTPASDQFIGMTRMRAVELGVPLIHAAVTGKSTFVDPLGSVGVTTGLGNVELITGSQEPGYATIYSSTGDLLMYLAALAGIVVWSMGRDLVGSATSITEEE